jgi:hypothetical protein
VRKNNDFNCERLHQLGSERRPVWLPECYYDNDVEVDPRYTYYYGPKYPVVEFFYRRREEPDYKERRFTGLFDRSQNVLLFQPGIFEFAQLEQGRYLIGDTQGMLRVYTIWELKKP